MKTSLIVIVLGLLVGCVNPAKHAEQVNSFKVEFLFEKDGCKVYRFEDGSKYIYYTNCSGTVEYHTGGKDDKFIQSNTSRNDTIIITR